MILRPDKQDYQGTAVTIDVARQLNVRKMLLAINKAYSSLNQEALKQKVEATYGETVVGIFPLSNEGKVADYIPELALAKPEWFGVCVVTKEGQIFEVGNCDQLFTIQSISKAFMYWVLN